MLRLLVPLIFLFVTESRQDPIIESRANMVARCAILVSKIREVRQRGGPMNYDVVINEVVNAACKKDLDCGKKYKSYRDTLSCFEQRMDSAWAKRSGLGLVCNNRNQHPCPFILPEYTLLQQQQGANENLKMLSGIIETLKAEKEATDRNHLISRCMWIKEAFRKKGATSSTEIILDYATTEGCKTGEQKQEECKKHYETMKDLIPCLQKRFLENQAGWYVCHNVGTPESPCTRPNQRPPPTTGS